MSMSQASATLEEHELLKALRKHGLEVHPQLASMLNEQHEHLTERRGCGYTQATRLLAEQINRPSLHALPRSRVFADGAELSTIQLIFSAQWLSIVAELALPESRLLAKLIRDVVLRDERGLEFPVISADKLAIGSCPLAEQFFLEIAYNRIRRGGRVNLITDSHNNPVLIEKCGLGDNHSCINVAELVINGVRLPVGSLIGVSYSEDCLRHAAQTSNGRGGLIPMSAITLARFLRLTTLVVSPQDRPRAFSAHYRQQLDSGLYSPDSTTMAHLVAYAKAQMP